MPKKCSYNPNLRIRQSTARAANKAISVLFDCDVIGWDEYQAIKYALDSLARNGEMPPAPAKRLLDLHEVAATLALGESTLKRLLGDNTIPLPKVRVGGAVRFRYEDVVKLVDAVEVLPSKGSDPQ